MGPHRARAATARDPLRRFHVDDRRGFHGAFLVPPALAMTIRSASNERLVRIAPGHWIVHVFPYFLAILLVGTSFLLLALAGVAALQGLFAAAVAFWLGMLLLLFVQHWFFLYLLSDSLGYLLITNRRVIHVTTKLLLQETLHEISFEKMKTVAATKKGFLQNLLSYGTLTFEGGTAVPYVAHPNSVVKDIEQAMGLR